MDDIQEQRDVTRPINILSDISSLSPESTPNIYLASLEVIHQSATQDINDVISSLDMDILQLTHKLLCAKVVSLFAQHGGRRIVNRTSKQRIVTDIISLGSSIVNCLDNKELSKIFLEPLNKEPYTDNAMDIADLIQTVARLGERVNSLEAEVTRLKASTGERLEQNTNVDVAVESNNDALLSAVTVNSIIPTRPSDHQAPTTSMTTSMTANVNTSNRFQVLESTDPDPEITNDVNVPQSSQQPIRLQAAPKRNKKVNQDTAQVYIGGVCGDTSEADITRELSLLGISTTSIVVKQLSHTDDWKSFVVTVPQAATGRIYNNPDWPRDIKIRPFLEKRNKAPDQQSRTLQAPRTQQNSQRSHQRQRRHHRPNNDQRDAHKRSKHSRQATRYDGRYENYNSGRNDGCHEEYHDRRREYPHWESSTYDLGRRYEHQYAYDASQYNGWSDYDHEFPSLYRSDQYHR